MLMKRLLATGISGFLGAFLLRTRQSAYHLIGIHHNQVPKLNSQHSLQRFDLNETSRLTELLQLTRPDAILYMAALSRPEHCEREQLRSYRINVLSPTLLAEYAAEQQIPFLYCSTDLVFQGTAAPYTPGALPRPISLYGLQKLDAENRIQDIYPEACIARLPLLYGLAEQGRNFVSEWLSRWDSGEPIRAFTDEYRTPLYAGDAARGLLHLLGTRKSGLWHLGGTDRLSRYDFARAMAQAFDVSPDLVIPTRQQESPRAINRPADVSLDSQSTYAMGFKPLPYRKALGHMARTHRKHKLQLKFSD